MFNVCKPLHKKLTKKKKYLNLNLDLMKKKWYSVFKKNKIIKPMILVNVKP